MRDQGSFFQQTISVLALIVSFIAALTPLFINSPINTFFLDQKIIQPVSFLVLIVGISVVWYFTQLSTNPSLKLFERKNPNNGFVTGHRINVTTNGFIKIATFLVVIFGISFIGIYDFSSTGQKSLMFIQGLCYLFMFLSLISLFALLYAQTKAQHTIQDILERFPLNVLETLNKYKLINSGIEISQNEILSNNELINLKLDPTQYMWSKKITVKTVNQPEKTFILIVDYAGSQVFKILKIT